MFISIEEAIKKKKGKVAVRGWVYQLRNLNDKIFIVLRDSSNILQCIFDRKKASNKLWLNAQKLTIESSIELEGEIYKENRAPNGFEILVKDMKIIQVAEKYPIPVRKQYHSPELLLDWRHLWIRDPKMQAIMKIRSNVFQAIRSYFNSKGYYEFHTPSIVSVAEAGQTLFEVNYYGNKLSLSQTWQFHAEAGMYGLEKIYTIAPSFRAEKSRTTRHLSEYWHAEVEVAWMNLDELMNLGEELVKSVIKKILEKNKKELKFLNRDDKLLKKYVIEKWPRITYDNAIKFLKEKKKMSIPWGKDLRTIEEEKLTEIFGLPVFVTNYPKEAMAFYKPRDPKNPKTALCFDLLIPEGWCELIGGSERDTNIEELKKSLKAAGEKIEDYEWYLDLNKYGAIPHAGFGLGVERLIAWLCGLENVRDAIPFPRTMLRFKP